MLRGAALEPSETSPAPALAAQACSPWRSARLWCRNALHTGDALLFFDMDVAGQVGDRLSLHAACPALGVRAVLLFKRWRGRRGRARQPLFWRIAARTRTRGASRDHSPGCVHTTPAPRARTQTSVKWTATQWIRSKAMGSFDPLKLAAQCADVDRDCSDKVWAWRSLRDEEASGCVQEGVGAAAERLRFLVCAARRSGRGSATWTLGWWGQPARAAGRARTACSARSTTSFATGATCAGGASSRACRRPEDSWWWCCCCARDLTLAVTLDARGESVLLFAATLALTLGARGEARREIHPAPFNILVLWPDGRLRLCLVEFGAAALPLPAMTSSAQP